MNPLKAADDGVLRSAVSSTERTTATPLNSLEDIDWIRGGSYSPETTTHRRVLEHTAGYAVVLVDADSGRRAQRRTQLTESGAARVIMASDELDVADALRLMDPDAVIVSASDTVMGGKLIRAVRALFDAHHEPVPVVAWQSRLVLQGTPAELNEAGADAVVDDGAGAEQVLSAVRALRRLVASATRRSPRELAPTTTVLDTLALSLALVDRDGRVRDANQALQSLWREMTGQQVSPVGAELAQLLVPSDRAALAAALTAQFGAQMGAVAELECTMGVTPARGIPVLVRLVRLDDSLQGPIVVAQLNDRREQRRVEQALNAGRWRALDRQQTLDITSRLRGLLSAVSQSMSPLAGGRPGSDLVLSSTHAAMLRGTLAQSETLIDALQAIASEQEHPASLVDVRARVTTHLELFRQMLPEHVVLTWDGGAHDVLVRGSESQLQQVLTALVMNAWDAQRSGGAIHVAVEHTDDTIVVAVEDNGPGVPEERHDWIFQPMATTRSAEGASGLGLVTARRSVEIHGGQLRIDKFRHMGARFEIILPRYRSRAKVTKAEPQLVAPRRVVAGL
jgi:signal transduction histidine kinase